MHIPNGFLDPKTSAGLMGAAAAVLAFCFAKVRQVATQVVPEKALAAIGGSISQGSKRVLNEFGRNLILKTGMIASIIFAMQMFNFPIANGTSGHFLGGAFAAIILGPFAGSIAIAVVVIVQAVFYGDGGLMALGANLVNMMLIGALVSYYVYSFLKKKVNNELAIGLTAWLSVVMAASFCALEIAVSGTHALGEVFPAMLKVHLVIGFVEGLFTIGLVQLVNKYFLKEGDKNEA